MATRKGRGGQRDQHPVRKMTEAEWKEAIRASLFSLHSHSMSLRADFELALAQPKQRGKQRNVDLKYLPALATDLRKLVGNGRGNRLLFRGCDRFSVPQPLIVRPMSLPSAEDDDRDYFALAAPFRSGQESDGTEQPEMPLVDCMALPCLEVRSHEVRRRWSWSELISEVANKSGAHTDDQRPVSWDIVGWYQVGGVPVIGRLLFQFSCLAIQASKPLLEEIGEAALSTVNPQVGFVEIDKVLAYIPRSGRPPTKSAQWATPPGSSS